MRLNYVYLKDLSKDLSKPIRMMLGEIVQNKEKVFTPVSHLIQQIYDQSAEFEQKNEKLDFFEQVYASAVPEMWFRFHQRDRSEARPIRDEIDRKDYIDIRDFDKDYIELSQEKLIDLRDNNFIELDEFGSFLERDNQSQEMFAWFPFFKFKVLIENVLIKSSSAIDTSAKFKKVAPRNAAEELTAWNFHHWFIINLLWKEEIEEIDWHYAWKKCLKFTEPAWVLHPIDNCSWFVFKTIQPEPDDDSDSALIVAWMREQDKDQMEEYITDTNNSLHGPVKSRYLGKRRNTDLFLLHKKTFKGYFNRSIKKKRNGESLKKFQNSS